MQGPDSAITKLPCSYLAVCSWRMVARNLRESLRKGCKIGAQCPLLPALSSQQLKWRAQSTLPLQVKMAKMCAMIASNRLQCHLPTKWPRFRLLGMHPAMLV